MRLPKTVTAVTSAAVLATGAMFATATPAAAESCRAHFCGTVNNETNTHIAVCLDWYGNGQGDNHYQWTSSRNYCKRVAYVQPKSEYGWPQQVDVDAFFIARGTSYTGDWFCIPHLLRAATWRHVRSGWWKFGTNCEQDIKKKY